MEFCDRRHSLSNWSSATADDRFDLDDDLKDDLMTSSTDLRLLLRRLLLSAPSSTSEILLLNAVVFLTTWKKIRINEINFCQTFPNVAEI